MAQITRVLGLSLLTSAIGVGIGLVLFRNMPYSEYIIPCIVLGSVGGIVGAVAGGAREIATAMHQKS